MANCGCQIDGVGSKRLQWFDIPYGMDVIAVLRYRNSPRPYAAVAYSRKGWGYYFANYKDGGTLSQIIGYAKTSASAKRRARIAVHHYYGLD